MFRKLVGKVLDRLGGEPARPVTTSTPDDWNRADKPSPASGAGELTVSFSNLGRSVTVARGTTILDAATEAGVDLNHYCGGMCSCGSCRIVLLSGEVSAKDDMEESTLAVVQDDERDRLACQAKVLADLAIEVPPQDF